MTRLVWFVRRLVHAVGLMLAVLVLAAIGSALVPGTWLVTVALLIGVVSWTGTARLARAEFMRLKGLEFVEAARAEGATRLRIVFRVILPNGMAPLVVSATLAVGAAMLFEGGLSFLGLGDPNVISWGLMIGQNRSFLLDAWWTVTFPGLALFLTVLSVALIGDGINDALDPRS